MVQKISILAPDLSGGGGNRVYLVAQALMLLNYDVKIYGFLFGEKIYPYPTFEIPIIWEKGCNYPQMITSMRKLFKKIDGDLLYAIKPRPNSFGMALLKRWQGKQPVILDMDDWELSWYGGDDWKYSPNPKQLARDILKKEGALRFPEHPLYINWMEKYTLNRANAITVVSRYLQKRFGGTYLPHAKDTNLYDPQKFDREVSRKELGLESYRVLMFPGTVRPHKGLEDVLMALDKLNQPDFRLVFVGGRDIGDGYIEQLMERWKQWIIRIPQQPMEKMPFIVAAADLITVPQLESVISIAQAPAKLIDAMAMAKPILSTRVGDIPDILGDGGYLVDPNSPEQIAEIISSIFNNLDDALARGQKARVRCLENHSIESTAAKLNQIIQKIQ